MSARFPRMASLRAPEELRERLATLGAELPVDDEVLAAPESPLAAPLELGGGLVAPNRFVIQPMEGWDGTPEGGPTDLTRRRWMRFGQSGAGWIWGGEAVAVRPDGRANPHQLVLSDLIRRRFLRVHRDLRFDGLTLHRAATEPLWPSVVT